MTDPVVFLPGHLCTGALYAPQIATLASEGVATQVVMLTGQDTMAAMAEAVPAKAPPRFALCGVSMGGNVTVEVMRRAPGRVTRLALLDTSARPDTPERTGRRRGDVSLAEQGGIEALLPDLPQRLLHPDRQTERAWRERVFATAREVGAEAQRRKGCAIFGRQDDRRILSAIVAPTLVLCGAQDIATPPEVHREMAGAIAEARLAIIERCGHLSTRGASDVVTEALETWLGLRRARAASGARRGTPRRR
jgi:pimeloyl-ACP methyl ester carboxylesterase